MKLIVQQLFFSFFLLFFLGIKSIDDPVLDDLDMDELKEMGEKMEQKRTDCSPERKVEILIESLKADKILQHEIYLHSNTPVTRSIHDLPTFSWTYAGSDDCFNFGVFPFFNQTRKVFFTRCSPFINSYINLTGKDLLDEVTELVQSFNIEDKPDEILPLFSHIKLEERKFGIYLRLAQRFCDDWTFQFSLPVYYLERNFFLTEEERNKIKMAPFIREMSPGSSDAEIQALLIEHLVADKVGLGDMRFHLLYNVVNDDCKRLSAGLFMTFPTAFAFRHGVVGGGFCKRTKIPNFTISDILAPLCDKKFGPPEQIAFKQKIQNFGFAVIDRLTANVAEIGLGSGHVGLAPMLEGEYKFNDQFSIVSQGILEYQFEAEEERFFLKKIDPASFDRDWNNPALAQENLNFLQKKFINSLFPTVLNAKVTPGLIGQFNTALKVQKDCWNGFVGYDFWSQGRETICLPACQAKTLRMDRAFNPASFQHKIFYGIGFDMPDEDRDFHAGVRGDITVASKGIGRDFTLALDLQLKY